jgi:hypothetical protein
MRFETIATRIVQLQKEQTKTRQDEGFGSLSSAERVAYERKEGLGVCNANSVRGQRDQQPLWWDDSSGHRSDL